jgi:hypothetical protein
VNVERANGVLRRLKISKGWAVPMFLYKVDLEGESHLEPIAVTGGTVGKEASLSWEE